MKVNNFRLLQTFLFLSFLSCSSSKPCLPQKDIDRTENIPQGVQEIAASILNGPRLKEEVERNDKEWWRPGKVPKMKNLRIGTPFPIYNISAGALLSADTNAPVSTIIKRSGQWWIPLLNKNKICMRFDAYQHDGKWVLGGSGAAFISWAWQKVIESWPPEKCFNPLFIRFGCKSYFTVPEKDDFNLTMVQSIKEKGGEGGVIPMNAKNAYSELTPSSEVIIEMKRAIIRGLEQKDMKDIPME